MMAANAGVARQVSSITAGHRRTVPATNEAFSWGQHVVGAIAECAAAKALGVFWSAHVNVFKTSDVGRYEVRYGGRRSGPDPSPTLKCRRNDPDSTILILVTGAAPIFTLAGWLTARDCKQERWLGAPLPGEPAYFVPVSSLNPMSSMPRSA